MENDEIKLKYSTKHNYDTHLQKNQVFLKDLDLGNSKRLFNEDELKKFQFAFGYTKEDITFFLIQLLIQEWSL